MKRYMKKIAVALLAVMLFSALASYAYASTATFSTFSVSGYAGDFASVGTAKEKRSTAPMVIFFDSSSVGVTHKVRALGRNNAGTGGTNCTIFNNMFVDYVICSENTYYNISNTIIEDGFTYATLSTAHGSSYGTVTGKWAPRSDRDFATPSAP